MGYADITLRHVTRQHPEALVKSFVPDAQVEILGWLDTQVTAIERRLDKAIAVRIEGEKRVLHVEFEHTLGVDVAYRVFQYQALIVMALRAAAPDELPPPVESIVIVLSGRKDPLPPTGEFRTSWPGRQFSGARFRIEAVYQRTIEELRTRGSVLWLIFAPLARDASAPAMRPIIEAIRAQVSAPDERAELYVAMLVMADIDPWGHNLREEIAAMMQTTDQDLIKVSRTLREAFDQGHQQATEKLLRRIFMRRIGRTLTEKEQEALVSRTRTQDPEQIEDRALTLEGEALAAWLLDPHAQ